MVNFTAVKAALSAKFIFSEELAEIICLALATGKNVLLYGPGGHAKSAMAEVALKAAGLSAFVKSFSEGTTVDDIYGGLDIPSLKEGKYCHLTQDSFLNSEVAIFEELFDAPASTLCSLKDTLTAKAYRQGAEFCESKCQSIIALTNVDPQEIISMGAAQAALIERFPLQLEVKWKSYTTADYLQLLEKVAPCGGMTTVVAGICAKTGGQISPRTAVHISQAIVGAASLRGSSIVTAADVVSAGKYFDGFDVSSVEDDIRQAKLDAERAKAEAEARAEFDKILHAMDEVISSHVEETSPLKLLQGAKLLKEFSRRMSVLRLPDSLYPEMEKAQERCASLSADYIESAEANTRVNITVI